jgi:ankyrin repeat protein
MTKRQFAVMGLLVLALGALLGCWGRDDDALVDAVLKKNDLARARTLLAQGADVNQPVGGDGETLVMAFALTPDTSTLRFLIEEAKADVNARSLTSGQTALMYAAMHGRAENIRMLVAAGAELDAAGSEGQTAVSIAKARNHPEIAQQLIALGAKDAEPKDILASARR